MPKPAAAVCGRPRIPPWSPLPGGAGLPDQTDLDLMNLTDLLDDEAGEPMVRLAGFGIARLFRRNAAEGVFWEDYAFDAHRGSVKRFVKSLMEPDGFPSKANP